MTLLSSLRVVFSSLAASFCLCAFGETNVVWKPHSKAVSYLYVIAKDEQFSSSILTGETDNPKSKSLEDLPPGVYYIKVKFIDRWGRESRFSPAKSFEVVKEHQASVINLPSINRFHLGFNADVSFVPNLEIKYDGKYFSKKNSFNNSFTKNFRAISLNWAGTIGGMTTTSDSSKILYTSLGAHQVSESKKFHYGLRSTLQYLNISDKSESESLDLNGAVFSLGPTFTLNMHPYFCFDSHLGIDKDFSKLTSLKITFFEMGFNNLTLSPGLGYTSLETLGNNGRLKIEALNFLITIKEDNDTVSN